MSLTERRIPPATASEILAIVGDVEAETIAAIVALGATREEVLEAQTWFSSDDYLQRKLHHTLHGRAAEVFGLLEAELVEPDR